MSKLRSIFRLVRSTSDVWIDRAMVDALPSADPLSLRLLVLNLLERRQEEGLFGLVRHYHLLPEELQAVIIDMAAEMDGALRSVTEISDRQTRQNMVEIVARSGGVRLAYLLTEQLHGREETLTEMAAEALLNLARRAVRQEGVEPGAFASRVEQLAAALKDAYGCYHQHQRAEVLVAVTCLAGRPEAGLIRMLSERRQTGRSAFEKILIAADHPEVRRALLWYAASNSLQPTVIQALSEPDLGTHLTEVVEQSHLLTVPAVQLAVRRVKVAEHLVPGVEEVRSMTPAAAGLLPRWLDTLSVADEQKITALATLASSSDRMLRLQALRGLMKLDHPRAREVISGMCFDPEVPIARTALRWLIARRWPGLEKLMMRLIGEGHPELHQTAELFLASIGFDRLWESWSQLPVEVCRTAGQALLKIDPDFPQQLVAKLEATSSEDRLTAVMMVRQLRQEARFEPQLIKLVRDPDTRVASAAVRALGVLHESTSAAEELQRVLKHRDDRVRANAIEALEQMDRLGQVQEALLNLARSEGNRSRANAIKALMTLPVSEALPSLASMLNDRDPRHRISALWVVEEMEVMELVRRVVALAKSDMDTGVRRRALRVLRGMEHQAQAMLEAVGGQRQKAAKEQYA